MSFRRFSFEISYHGNILSDWKKGGQIDYLQLHFYQFWKFGDDRSGTV